MDRILLIDGEPFNVSEIGRDMDRRIIRAFRGAQMADQEILRDTVPVQLPTPPTANRHERRKQAKLERMHGQAR